MFQCRILEKPHFKAAAWHEIVIKKARSKKYQKVSLNSMATSTREIQFAFALTYTLIGFALLESKFSYENFETSASEIRIL